MVRWVSARTQWGARSKRTCAHDGEVFAFKFLPSSCVRTDCMSPNDKFKVGLAHQGAERVP